MVSVSKHLSLYFELIFRNLMWCEVRGPTHSFLWMSCPIALLKDWMAFRLLLTLEFLWSFVSYWFLLLPLLSKQMDSLRFCYACHPFQEHARFSRITISLLSVCSRFLSCFQVYPPLTSLILVCFLPLTSFFRVLFCFVFFLSFCRTITFTYPSTFFWHGD